jgi:hypothetical protein
MVDTSAGQRRSPEGSEDEGPYVSSGISYDGPRKYVPLRLGFSVGLVVAFAAGVLFFTLGSVANGASPQSSAISASPASATQPVKTVTAPQAKTPSVSPVTTTASTPAATVQNAAPAGAAAATPSTTDLVAQVEAAGIVPAPNWSWSIGNTASQCGVIAGAGLATGCTFWAGGVEQTIFTGTPSLALVAHEVANAETEHFALATLLSEVSAAAAGTSWSPTDAVASCLVMHFMGFEDNVAGSWQCPAGLANSVAAHIHDTIVTTQTTATCGVTTHASSTLTFTASAGTLTVTSPSGDSAPQTVDAGTPVTVSGMGTFVAEDLGGTASVTGICEG